MQKHLAITAFAFALAFASAPASAQHRHHHAHHHPRAIASEVIDAGGRSGSCLRFRATRFEWCGCGSADRVGLDNSTGFWNLASHWFVLPRTERAPGMAAVRRHHVLILVRQIEGAIWWVFDPNSGHGRAHEHAVNTAGLAIVDPHGEPRGRFRRLASR